MKNSKIKKEIIAQKGQFDMTAWGQEKSEAVLNEIVCELRLLDDHERRTYESRDSDLIANTRASLAAMAWNVTKIYAFFCDGQWEPKDRDTLIGEREAGLDRLKKTYSSNEPRPDRSDHSSSLF